MPDQWITFDCFGTLVDWNTGFASILRPVMGDRTAEVLRAYHQFERILEAERPHRRYRDVLVQAALRAAEKVGVLMSETDARRLPGQWATMPVFADVEPMLAGLRARGWKLAVLTNCDDDLFAGTHACFRQPFDLVVTAERVRDYKPSLAHFRDFSRDTGVPHDQWLHIACSWFHDIAPARQTGIRSIWLDRDRTGDDPTIASAHIQTADEVCAAVDRLSNGESGEWKVES